MADETAIVEGIPRWTGETKGVWIEAGVNGIDFEVLGNPCAILATEGGPQRAHLFPRRAEDFIRRRAPTRFDLLQTADR